MLNKLISFVRRKISPRYKFNQQFEKGTWAGLRDIGELGRYSIIAGYVSFFCKQARVLDLGCGEGILQERLAGTHYSAYLGIDFSDVAIANCSAYANSKTKFAVGDLNNLTVDGEHDAIIYNESIYYLKDPVAAVRRLLANLSAGGVFIFSIVDKHGDVQDSYWKDLNSVLQLTDSTRVFNRDGDSWTIQVYKKRDQTK